MMIFVLIKLAAIYYRLLQIEQIDYGLHPRFHIYIEQGIFQRVCQLLFPTNSFFYEVKRVV